jgi:hypothetical protein
MASELHVDAIKHSGGTSAMTIDTNGRVKSNNYLFKAYYTQSGTWTAGAGTGGAFRFNNTELNQGFDLTNINGTGLIYAPVTGTYFISARFLVDSSASAGNAYVTIQKNYTGSTASQANNFMATAYPYITASHYGDVNISTLVYLTTSDYFIIRKADSLPYYGDTAHYRYHQVSAYLVG